MPIDSAALDTLEADLDHVVRERIHRTADLIVAAKERGRNVAVITGSGPNIHEGVTTLLAELMRVGIVDGITTSSAVIAHEMGGTLDRVKRCAGEPLDIDPAWLPRGGDFELTELDPAALAEIEMQMPIDHALIERIKSAPGKSIIKAAGNLGYPMGLWLEKFAIEILALAHVHKKSFEEIAGLGADARTMIGIGARARKPVMVTIPQLVGGGMIGLCIGDSISLVERATRLAHMLDAADVIIESGVALTQEIHDGPFELYTGHGIWSAWQDHFAYTLEGKSLIRIDLDPALEQVCAIEREAGGVQEAITDGLPKTKLFKVPFRMEMSGFARHEGSIPIIEDIGVVWPLIARRVAYKLGIELDFMSYPQQTRPGMAMREWIVSEVRPMSRSRMLKALHERD
ncbi:MAG: hypothetical protein SGI88_02990 [Candidatus Hydrogenedentes bacterium]|nr:hypothetical protein [Candidatus Hydrogenedentota bacterium]